MHRREGKCKVEEVRRRESREVDKAEDSNREEERDKQYRNKMN